MKKFFHFICSQKESDSLPCESVALFTHVIRNSCLMRVCSEYAKCAAAILCGGICSDEIAQLMLAELKRMECTSLIADVDDLACLDGLCHSIGIRLYVPPKLFRHTEYAIVIEKGNVCSGSYRRHIDALRERYGGRFSVDLTPLRLELTPPSDVCGEALSCEELALRLKSANETCCSSELCARYFTCCIGNMNKYIIYDDAKTLCEKASLALSRGAQAVFVPYAEVKNMTIELI